jgi:exopolysaccharide biosynthesis protein
MAVWNVDDAPADAILSLNAGQFAGGAVWGWVVHDGVEYRKPGRGPLAAAVIVEADGGVHLADDSEVERRRVGGIPDRPSRVVEAFQSYPVLLEGDGQVPRILREGSPEIDLDHRDARLALGGLADGRVVIALTRFDALGPAFGSVPFGLTIPEMSALMGALGCRWAVALDGGVSAQLSLQGADGERRSWHGLRRVPLALVAAPRFR